MARSRARHTQDRGAQHTTRAMTHEETVRAVRRLGVKGASALAVGDVGSLYNCVSVTGGRTLDIGDSHTWLSGCGAAYKNWDVDCTPGRGSTVGTYILAKRLRRRHTKVVFDLATNDRGDPVAYARNLRWVWDAIGKDRKLVLVTSWVPGAPSTADLVNEAIHDFADGKSRVAVAEWYDYGLAHSVPAGDGVHYDSTGYAARVALVKAAHASL